MDDNTYDQLYAAIIAEFVDVTQAPNTGAFFLLAPNAPELPGAYLPPNAESYYDQDEQLIGTGADFEAEFRNRNNGNDPSLTFVILPWPP